jgi:hypothetical protein
MGPPFKESAEPNLNLQPLSVLLTPSPHPIRCALCPGLHPDQRAASYHSAVGRAVVGHPCSVQRGGDAPRQSFPAGGRQAQPQH